MNIIVQKYGGSSVKSKETLQKVCDNIIKNKESNNDLIVVVSAQGNTTNNLISTAKEYTNNNITSKKDLDFLLSTGEMQTAALLSLMLNAKGYESVCLNGAQAGIITTSEFGNAKITNILTDNITSYLNEGKIVIITGFQGIDKLGNITTLGRGGSDLSAVAIASSMKAKKCEIYSDIDGIFSADPKIIPNATLIPKIVKIISKNTFNNSLGSTVQDTSEDLNVHFITKKENLTKICIVGSLILENSNVLNNIYTIANKLNTKIYMITTNELSINIIVDTAIANSFIQELHNTLIIKEE